MSQPFDKSRYDWFRDRPGVVLDSNGRPRPALVTPLDVFTVHYGGAGTSWTDPDDTATELWAVELYARSTGKPNEYNSSGDAQGVTWEYAGPFRAAHSAGENTTAWGHLALYGLEQLTEAEAQGLIVGIRRARQQCVTAGYLTADHQVVAHQDMPDAATACPGPLYDVERWWNQIIAPLTEPEEPDMLKPQFLWRHRDHPGMFWVCDGSVVHVDEHMRDELIRLGVPQILSTNNDVWESYKRVARGLT